MEMAILYVTIKFYKGFLRETLGALCSNLEDRRRFAIGSNGLIKQTREITAQKILLPEPKSSSLTGQMKLWLSMVTWQFFAESV